MAGVLPRRFVLCMQFVFAAHVVVWVFDTCRTIGDHKYRVDRVTVGLSLVRRA